MTIKLRSTQARNHATDTGRIMPTVVWDEVTGIPTSVFKDMHERLTSAVGNFSKPVGVIMVGGLAVNAHAMPRVTTDFDAVLFANDVPLHKPKIREMFTSGLRDALGMHFRVTNPQGGNRSAGFIVTDTRYLLERGKATCSSVGIPNGIQVDTYFTRPQNNVPLSHIAEFAVPITITHEGAKFTVMAASIPTLVQMKLASGREKDLLDVRAMVTGNFESAEEFLSDSSTVVEFGALSARKKGMSVEEVRAKLSRAMRLQTE